MIRSTSKGVLLAVALMGLVATPRVPAEEPIASDTEFELDPDRPVTTLEAWDAITDFVAQISWSAHDSKLSGTQEGSSLLPAVTAKWEKYVMLPDVKQQLDTLRARAKQESAAGDEAALKRTIAEASPLLSSQVFRIGAIMRYTTYYERVDTQRKALEPWLARATASEKQSAEEQISSLFGTLDAQLDSTIVRKKPDAEAEDPHYQVTDSGQRALNQRRLTLVKSQASLPLPYEMAPILRTDACPPPVAAAPGNERLSLGPDFPSAEEHYPRVEKQSGIEGPVVVRVIVSDDGCVIRAEVMESSGSPGLDRGALELAMAGKYVPGTKDGKPMPGTMKFAVKFELRDAE